MPVRPPRREEKDDLLRVTVQVGARRFSEDLAAQAMIRPNLEALNEALSTNPSRFAEWAMLEALARTELDTLTSSLSRLDAETKDVEATVYLEAITPPDPPQQGWKAPTVDAAKSLVTTDPRKRALVERRAAVEDAVLRAKENLRLLEVGRKTIEEKRDSLMELSRNIRQEMQTKLAVRGTEDLSKFKPGASAVQSR